MKKLLNKRLLILIVSLFICMTAVTYVTYAYYVSDVVGNESVSSVQITGGSLYINYTNNSGQIVADAILPGWSTEKKFTINVSANYDKTNVNSYNISYAIFLVIDENDFFAGSLLYRLSPIDTDLSKEGIYKDDTFKVIPEGTNTDGLTIGRAYFPNDTVSHSYNLIIKYVNNEEVDQTLEMGGKFSARVVIDSSN